MASDLASPSGSLFSDHGSLTSFWSDYSDDLFGTSLELAPSPRYSIGNPRENWTASPRRDPKLNSQISGERDLYVLSGLADPDRSRAAAAAAAACRGRFLDPAFSLSDCSDAPATPSRDPFVGESVREPVLLRTIASTISAFLSSPAFSPDHRRRRHFRDVDSPLNSPLNSPHLRGVADPSDAMPDFGDGRHNSSYHMSLPSFAQIQSVRTERASAPTAASLHNRSSSQACCIPNHPSKSRSFSSKLKKLAKKFRIRVK